MPFQYKRSGKISRAQKYRIKWKAPKKKEKKLLKLFQNKEILAIITTEPIKYRLVGDEMSRYTTKRIRGNNKTPSQINKLKNDVVQAEFLTF